LEHLGIYGMMILKLVLGWTGFIWLRIRTNDMLLWVQHLIFGFHKMLGISWLAEKMFASQYKLCSMEESVGFIFCGFYASGCQHCKWGHCPHSTPGGHWMLQKELSQIRNVCDMQYSV
jgi:hypothetical protein